MAKKITGQILHADGGFMRSGASGEHRNIST